MLETMLLPDTNAPIETFGLDKFSDESQEGKRILELLIQREKFAFEKLLLGYLSQWFMNEDCRRLILTFLSLQT